MGAVSRAFIERNPMSRVMKFHPEFEMTSGFERQQFKPSVNSTDNFAYHIVNLTIVPIITGVQNLNENGVKTTLRLTRAHRLPLSCITSRVYEASKISSGHRFQYRTR